MKICFFDTETTGFVRKNDDLLSPLQPRCVQLAASLTDQNGQVLHTVSAIIKPEGFTIPEQVANIHGITTEIALALGLNRRLVFALFGDMIRQADRVVAHNFDYDDKIMQIESAHSAISLQTEEFAWAPRSVFCTMRETTQLCCIPSARGGFKWPKLQELHNFLFGTEFENAHTATADVEAMIRCYFELRRRGHVI